MPVTFDASASSDPNGATLSYSWNFGDGTTREGEQVTHTYNFPGVYSVILTVDNGTCSDQVNQVVQVGAGLSDLGIFTKNSDIGSVAVTGTAFHAAGLYTLTGSGSDIGGAADNYQFIRRPHEGNGEIIARVKSLVNTNPDAKAGVIFRSNTTADAMMAMVMQRPDNQVAFQWRSTAGGNAQWSGSWEGTTGKVKFLRLVRSGDSFAGYYSTMTANGPWVQIGSSQNISMGSEALIGLGATAHDDGEVTTAEFEKVRIENIAGAEALIINAKIILAGPWNGTSHNLDLSTFGVIPLLQPFSPAPWSFAGQEKVTGVPANAVDWVLVKVLDGGDHSSIVAERACFVRGDGMLMDLDGSVGVDFGVVPIESGYISIHHRNHIGVMTQFSINMDD